MVRLFILAASVALILMSCGGSDAATTSSTTSAPVQGTPADDSHQTTTTAAATTSSVDGGDAPPADPGVSSSGGSGVILADLCAGGQPLDGAISLEDLVSFGLLSSTDATVEGPGTSLDATAYEAFGFLCNIFEDVGDGETLVTIGVSGGSSTWDNAVDQGDAPAEKMGDWDVIVGSNWVIPLVMCTTDAAGNQDCLWVTWVPADGSIPDTATQERLMRPLAEAIATRSTVDIPRN